MNRYYRIISTALLLLLIVTIAGLIMTSRPIVEHRSGPPYRNAPFYRLTTVTQDQFDTARKLAACAGTLEEQWMAREVLRIADNEVDLAFATALQEAAEHPTPLSAEAQAISERLKRAQAQMDRDQAELERLKRTLAGAKESSKDALERQLQLIEAQADLDQDELDDAHQDLIRAGGDPQGIIERMKQRYEAREQATGGLQALVPSGPQNSVEETQSQHVVALARAWYSLRGKIERLQQAERDARAQGAELKISHEKADQADKEQEAQESTPRAEGSAAAQSGNATVATSSNPGAAKVTGLKTRSANRKNLQVLDKRLEDETQLADMYQRWSGLIRERARQRAHLLLYCLLGILVIASLTTVFDVWVSRSLAKLSVVRRQVHTFRSVAGYAIRGVGVILVLLVIFGPPTQFAAVLALAGAGLTVALKDFIVAFIGWFALMGRNGIRVGDWVEINGVSGEVLEIGPMRTILLETGSWSDAGHPTGRKVTFMNGFAVEGNYFNFSTSGQWMWDEIQFVVPAESDPFVVAEALKGLVAAETQKSAELATDEWRKVAPSATPQVFRGEPVMSVRPTGSGAMLVIRYITRANERHDVRARIYRGMIDLQRRKDVEPSTSTVEPTGAGVPNPPPNPSHHAGIS
jgi:small-conductance mechanosensitive channel